MIDWSNPNKLRFAQVYNDDHFAYRPRYVGSFMDADGKTRRHVVCLRNWINREGASYAFIIYDENGYPLSECGPNPTASTGVFDTKIVNGPEIYVVGEATNHGVGVNVTYEGNTPVKVELV